MKTRLHRLQALGICSCSGFRDSFFAGWLKFRSRRAPICSNESEIASNEQPDMPAAPSISEVLLIRQQHRCVNSACSDCDLNSDSSSTSTLSLDPYFPRFQKSKARRGAETPSNCNKYVLRQTPNSRLHPWNISVCSLLPRNNLHWTCRCQVHPTQDKTSQRGPALKLWILGILVAESYNIVVQYVGRST